MLVLCNPPRRGRGEPANPRLLHPLVWIPCSTFTIQGVAQDAVRLLLFPFSLLGKAKQWFYANKEAVSTWENCSNAFLGKFFPLDKKQCPPEQDLWVSATHG
jgi:hypothetical protein